MKSQLHDSEKKYCYLGNCANTQPDEETKIRFNEVTLLN